jgi:hypothetical protein
MALVSEGGIDVVQHANQNRQHIRHREIFGGVFETANDVRPSACQFNMCIVFVNGPEYGAGAVRRGLITHQHGIEVTD